MTKLFSITYLGPVQFFAHLMSADKALIEYHCNYIKQTYRNRCTILGANGPLSLIIPVEKYNGLKCPTKDIRLSYDTPWQALHWKSIKSAYNSSPYFEYYQDDFKPFYEKKYDYLFDFNLKLMDVVLEMISLQIDIDQTNTFQTDFDASKTIDLREVIHPKKDFYTSDPDFKPKPYRQLFLDKFGFVENLSIIDLLFNKGPESLIILKDSIRSKL